MPRTRDLLRKFRTAGAPGSAASTGAPADRVAELSAELLPLLSRLDPARDRAALIRAAADDDARAIRTEATDRARARLADVADRVHDARAAAATQAARRATEDAAQILEQAEREAQAIRTRGRERISALVDQIIATLPDAAPGGPP